MSIAQQLERVPPQNLEAEQGVLGSMLLDRDAIARAIEGLRADDFYRDAHRVIFQAMVELFERGEPVDLITVTNRLAANGKLDDVGGATYVASLPNAVPTAANVDFYANIVLEKSMLRALISAGTHIAAMGYDGADDVAAMIDHAEKLVFGISASDPLTLTIVGSTLALVALLASLLPAYRAARLDPLVALREK